MTTSIGTIAQQALRRLGVRVVPLDDSPTLTEMVPFADIATAALVELGVLNSEQTPATWLSTPEEIAGRALVELGVINWFMPPPAVWVTTPEDIATAALVELGVIAADETPSDSDQALAIDKVAAVHRSLIAQGIAAWTLDAIPKDFTEEYTKLTAAMAASSFGKAVDPAIVALLEGRIRAGATVEHNDQVFMLRIVDDVHRSLVAQGIAGWTLDTIPRAFAEEYVKLTVNYAAPSFGKQADPAMVAMLEGRIRAGATVLNNNQAFMLDKVASVHAALDAQGVVWWASGSVPRAFAEEYSKLTAIYAATSFGKQADPAMIPALEARVRKGAMVLSSDDNAQQAVQAVHDDLVMRGIARWTVFDIPDAVGTNAYTILAADRLAPLFGMDTDPKDTALAMMSLYRFIALPTSGETVATAYF